VVVAQDKDMLLYFIVAVVLSMPLIAWIPAKFWYLCGDPWCLHAYPDWLDRLLYNLSSPLLASDMILAAEQMDFFEIWLATVIILEILSLLLLFIFRKSF